MVKLSKTLTVKTISVRVTKDELKMIEALKQKTGIRADGDILRMGVRCLAERQKPTPAVRWMMEKETGK